jgi:hypothetical protein
MPQLQHPNSPLFYYGPPTSAKMSQQVPHPESWYTWTGTRPTKFLARQRTSGLG